MPIIDLLATSQSSAFLFPAQSFMPQRVSDYAAPDAISRLLQAHFKPELAPFMTASLVGQLMALAAALSFAVSNVLIAQGSRGGGKSDASVAFSIFVTMLLSCLAWLVIERGHIPTADPEAFYWGITWFALAGFAALILGRTLVYTSIQTIGVIRASAVRRLNPIFSAVIGFVILGETVGDLGVLGMILVCLAVGALVAKPWLTGAVSRDGSNLPIMAYSWGFAAAIAYSISYLFRKLGLDDISGPAFGTFVSAGFGLAIYAVIGLFVPRYRKALLGMFANVNPHMMAAGIFISVGQILLFAALAFERIAVVAMIGSLEMFFSTSLAVMFGADKRPDAFTVIAGIVATAGVIMLALHG